MAGGSLFIRKRFDDSDDPIAEHFTRYEIEEACRMIDLNYPEFNRDGWTYIGPDRQSIRFHTWQIGLQNINNNLLEDILDILKPRVGYYIHNGISSEEYSSLEFQPIDKILEMMKQQGS